jgi:MFS transporter, PAT family, beta-lactamase induction signal transducer AmpG
VGFTHPVVFLILYLPFGIVGGYIGVTVAYLLSRAGASITEIAALIALSTLPQTWKLLWAPLVDTTLTAKRWYLFSTTITGLILLGMAFIPAQQGAIRLLDALTLIVNIACSISAMSCESLMAGDTAPDQMGRAGGYSQAGNLGGGGLGGGAGLWMAQHVAPWSAGAVLGAACVVCCGALWWMGEPVRARSTVRYATRLIGVGKDVWSIARSRLGLLTLFIFLLPMCTAAASNLWPALADDWRADGDTVALVNGALAGLTSMGGCLVGGYLCDFIGRRSGYAYAGILLALCAAGMALAPRTPAMFVVFTSAYSFVTGLAYAAFSSATLEAIGKDSAATQYNVLACVANVPIVAMTVFDGWAQARWGSGGMLYAEALISVVAVAAYAVVALATRRPEAALERPQEFKLP